MRASPRESTCAGDGVSRSRCVTCCTRRQLVESGEACYVWPLCPGSSLPISHNRLREIGGPPHPHPLFRHSLLRCSTLTPELVALFPLLTSVTSTVSFGFCPTFWCLFQCLYFSFWSSMCGTDLRSQTQRCSLF